MYAMNACVCTRVGQCIGGECLCVYACVCARGWEISQVESVYVCMYVCARVGQCLQLLVVTDVSNADVCAQITRHVSGAKHAW